MRDGARPLAAWALLLSVTGLLNLVWAGLSVETATFGAAILTVLLFALSVALRPRHDGPEAVPRLSFAPMLTALGLAALLFGFTFGHFLIYFGAGLMLAGLGRLWAELRAQRRGWR